MEKLEKISSGCGNFRNGWKEERLPVNTSEPLAFNVFDRARWWLLYSRCFSIFIVVGGDNSTHHCGSCNYSDGAIEFRSTLSLSVTLSTTDASRGTMQGSIPDKG